MRFSIFKIRVLHVLALKRLKRLQIEAIIFACIHDLFFEFAIDSVVAKKKKRKKESVRETNKAAGEWEKDRQIREKDGIRWFHPRGINRVDIELFARRRDPSFFRSLDSASPTHTLASTYVPWPSTK